MPETFTVATRGRGFHDITDRVQTIVGASGVDGGLCVVFVHHTSASLLVGENADPAVQRDLERFFGDLVPDGDARFGHDAEGPDDMPAHVRAALTQTSVALPVNAARCDLGTWQGLYLWEHRHEGHRRRVSVTVIAEARGPAAPTDRPRGRPARWAAPPRASAAPPAARAAPPRSRRPR